MAESRGGSPAFHIRRVSFAHAEGAIRAVRREVFVLEQGVSEPEEWDGLDPGCVHLLAVGEGGEPIGTARLVVEGSEGRVGRMAVLASHRRRGVGGRLLGELLDIAREKGLRRLALGAQLHAIPFYERHGFVAMGPVFLDAAIEHRKMCLELYPKRGPDRAGSG